MIYEYGDKVRIWAIFGHPTGTVMSNAHEIHGSVAVYQVAYSLENGDSFKEWFKTSDLALVERRDPHGVKCTCGLESGSRHGGIHAEWCKKRGVHNG